MFGLGEHIGGAQRRVGGGVGYNQRFGRAVESVNADIAVNQFLGKRDEHVARAADHIHGRDALRSVCHRRHRLGAAGGEHPVNSGYLRRGEDDGGRKPIRAGGRTEYDIADSGDPRGYGGHQNRGRERSAAARGIDAHPVARADETAVSGREVHPVLGAGGFVVAADPFGGQLQRFQHGRIYGVRRGFDSGRRDFHPIQLHAFQRERQPPYRVVAVGADFGHYAGHYVGRRQAGAEYALRGVQNRGRNAGEIETPALGQRAPGRIQPVDYLHDR